MGADEQYTSWLSTLGSKEAVNEPVILTTDSYL